jgi:YVTN family beta-propeller protein
MSLDARARRAAQAARSNVDRLPPPPAIGVLVARRRRRAAAAQALALACIVVAAAQVWRVLPVANFEPGAPRLPRHVQAAIKVGKAPSAVLVAQGSVWVANSGDGTVSRIDPATNRVTATIGVDGNPARLTADAGAVWVANPAALQRIDPGTNQVVQTMPLPAGLGDVLAADGYLWMSLGDGTVRRLDPADGRMLASISVAPGGVSALASGGGRLWAANGGTLVAIDPRRGAVTERFVNEAYNLQLVTGVPQIVDLAVTGGVAWEARSDGWVARFQVDPPRTKVRDLESPFPQAGVTALDAGPTGAFLSNPSLRTVTRLDPSTRQAKASIQLPDPSQLAVGADAVWVTASSPGILYRIDPQATD